MNKIYPGVFDRVKAVMVDTGLLFAMMIALTYVFNMFESVPDTARIIAFVFLFFLYDPVLTSGFGATIGHRIIGLRVRSEKDASKKISFPLALVRFLVKALLGWISLLTVSGNEKRRAIHDFVSGSIVMHDKKASS